MLNNKFVDDSEVEVSITESNNKFREKQIKVYFPEIKDVDKYEIKWQCLQYFTHVLKKLHMQKVTFGELSLAKIKIIELEHIDTKETIDLYFNLVDTFCNDEDCQSHIDLAKD